MMTISDIELLRSDALRSAIEQNIGRNPLDIALDKHLPHARLIADQVKVLQRAARKLPTYFEARAMMTQRGYEQSSSEACAERRRLSGDTLLDLTCGLGVDTVAMSRKFSRVVALERDAVLAEVTRENLRRMGISNVEIVCQSAEEYLATSDEHFDWCMADPDRRNEMGSRFVRLEECSPNVVALRQAIADHADNLCIKCSPLFDVGEAERLFGDCFVESVSVGGECKEVNIYIGNGWSGIAAEVQGCEAVQCSCTEWLAQQFSPAVQSFDELARYRYLTLPDAALQHSRLVAQLRTEGADVWSNDGVALSNEPLPPSVGRCAEIIRMCEFSVRQLRRQLKGRRINIYRRQFQMSNGEICRRLSLCEGGREDWCFTTIGKFYIAAELRFL